MKATTWLAMPGKACSASPPKLVTTRSPGSSSSPSVWGMLTSRLNPVQHISRFRQMSVWKRWNSSSDFRTKKRNVSLCWRRSSVAPSSGTRVGSGAYAIGRQPSAAISPAGRMAGWPRQGRCRPATSKIRRDRAAIQRQYEVYASGSKEIVCVEDLRARQRLFGTSAGTFRDSDGSSAVLQPYFADGPGTFRPGLYLTNGRGTYLTK